MAKQNIDTQTIINQSPDAFVVFIDLDNQGLPIRDVQYAKKVPDILDIEEIALTMGNTGEVGKFRIKINNANNKYFVKDDMEYEIELLKGGEIVVATTYEYVKDTKTGKRTNKKVQNSDGIDKVIDITYDTLPASLTWTSAQDFLENRAYDRVRSAPENDPSSPIYLYYQDPSEKYNLQFLMDLETNKSIIETLAKGKIKYRVIPHEKLEEFAKSPISTTIRDSLSHNELYPGNHQRNIEELEDFISTTSPKTPSPLNSSTDTIQKTDIPDTGKIGDTNSSTLGYSAIITLDENEAIRLLQNSEIQAAFFEKYGGQLEHGRCIFEPMQFCAIFMRRRFKDEDDPEDMVLVFTGYVDSVSDGYDAGKHQLSIAGSDVTKLMHITQANVNPSIFTQKLPDSPSYKLWQSRFAGLEGWEIIKLLTVGGTLKTDGAQEFPFYGTGQFEILAEGKPGATRFGTIFESNVSMSTLLDNMAWSRVESEKDEPDKIERLLFNKKTVHIQTLPFDNSPVNTLQSYDLYKRIFGMSFGNWQNEYVTHLEIAKMVADQTNYEFYADGFGDIWYHQPRFHNYHILTDDSPEVYILRDEDIVNANFTESDENIVTSVYLTGQPNYYTGQLEPPEWAGFYEDPGLVMKYGRRMLSYSHPYIVEGGNLNYFARSYMQRINAGRMTGKVTIIGRPEIKMHMPVYVPYRNMIYYVVGISHSFNFQDTFKTSLTLKYGRKPWEVLPEIYEYTEKAGPSFATSKRPQHQNTVKEDNALKEERRDKTATDVGKSGKNVSIADTDKTSSSKATDDFPNIDITDPNAFRREDILPTDATGVVINPLDIPDPKEDK